MQGGHGGWCWVGTMCTWAALPGTCGSVRPSTSSQASISWPEHDVTDKAAVHRLRLVGMVGRHLVVVDAQRLERGDVLGLLLRVEVVLNQQVAVVVIAHARGAVGGDDRRQRALRPLTRHRPRPGSASR